IRVRVLPNGVAGFGLERYDDVVLPAMEARIEHASLLSDRRVAVAQPARPDALRAARWPGIGESRGGGDKVAIRAAPHWPIFGARGCGAYRYERHDQSDQKQFEKPHLGIVSAIAPRDDA